MKSQQLSVQTLSVEIRVLSINQKKMTLSVFNQIREEPLFDKDFNKRGQTFGYVNRDGFWIIWNREGELRKTKMQKIETETPKYMAELVKRMEEIDSKIQEEFGFKDFNWTYRDERTWNSVTEEFAYEQLSKAEDFVEKYNSFYDELLGEKNQLFISI